jgi:hypothetical protein
VTYEELIDDLSRRIDALPPRATAAVFWVLGSGLLAALEAPPEWAGWFAGARGAGYRFVTTGEKVPEVGRLWAQAAAPVDAETSALFTSAVVCLSTPLGIAVDPGNAHGSWVEHAFWPLLNSVSLELFDDAAFPGDDEDLDRIAATPRFAAAADYVRDAVARLARDPAPDPATLRALLAGAALLTGAGTAGRGSPTTTEGPP